MLTPEEWQVLLLSGDEESHFFFFFTGDIARAKALKVENNNVGSKERQRVV